MQRKLSPEIFGRLVEDELFVDEEIYIIPLRFGFLIQNSKF
jgi:hypothetical protein